jgi:hypothetical protein
LRLPKNWRSFTLGELIDAYVLLERTVRASKPKRGRGPTRAITFNGETHNVAEWERRMGVGHHTILKRLQAGWPVGAAITKPPLGRGNLV